MERCSEALLDGRNVIESADGTTVVVWFDDDGDADIVVDYPMIAQYTISIPNGLGLCVSGDGILRTLKTVHFATNDPLSLCIFSLDAVAPMYVIHGGCDVACLPPSVVPMRTSSLPDGGGSFMIECDDNAGYGSALTGTLALELVQIFGEYEFITALRTRNTKQLAPPSMPPPQVPEPKYDTVSIMDAISYFRHIIDWARSAADVTIQHVVDHLFVERISRHWLPCWGLVGGGVVFLPYIINTSGEGCGDEFVQEWQWLQHPFQRLGVHAHARMRQNPQHLVVSAMLDIITSREFAKRFIPEWLVDLLEDHEFKRMLCGVFVQAPTKFAYDLLFDAVDMLDEGLRQPLRDELKKSTHDRTLWEFMLMSFQLAACE